jgi:hypothetical protein
LALPFLIAFAVKTSGVVLYFLFGFKPEKLITIARVDLDITDLDSLKNAERDINTCVTEGPNPTVKIRKPIHRVFVNRKDKVTGF